jgi:hypothetical protein
MPEILRPFIGYNLGDDNPEILEPKLFAVAATGGKWTSRPLEVKGRGDKTLWIKSNRALSLKLYIAPYRGCKASELLLYKTSLTVNANDPFIYNINEVIPFLVIELESAPAGLAASVEGWLFAQ